VVVTALVSASLSAAALFPLAWAYADAYTQQYTVTSGPYYPSWYADNCLTAYIASGSHYNYGSIYSSVDPGRCAGTAANMGAGWQGIYVVGFEDGSWCGNTSWVYNGSAGSGYWIGPYGLCGQPSGTHNYMTETVGEVWSYLNGSWQYISAGAVFSPTQN
jgi:hypothetical protein